MGRLQMVVNGSTIDIDVSESRYLSEVLRNDLQLTGTKIGCNEAECGICTVLVNGVPVVSCVYPAFKAQGARVETIESLSKNGALHPLQQAFLDHGAVQCGICTPGVIMTAKALIDQRIAAGEPVTEGRHRYRTQRHVLPMHGLPKRDPRHSAGIGAGRSATRSSDAGCWRRGRATGTESGRSRQDNRRGAIHGRLLLCWHAACTHEAGRSATCTNSLD